MIAVLTGDLVNSTKMTSSTYSQVTKQLQSLLNDANNKFLAIGEIYRGDEFQIQYPTPLYALKSVLLIKLALHFSAASTKPIQCSLSLAYGNHDIYDTKPNTSSGPVFIASGRGLDKTPRGELSLSFEAQHNRDKTLLLTKFLNHILNRLTKSQAELLYQYIQHDFTDHSTMAEITTTSRQNISNRLSNIGASLVKDYMKAINEQVALIGAKQ